MGNLESIKPSKVALDMEDMQSSYLLADGLPPGAAEVELARADRLVEPVRK